MNEEYITDDEYPDYFLKLNDLRPRIVQALPIKPGMQILDLATGYGIFALEIARAKTDSRIVGIDIADDGTTNAAHKIADRGFADRIDIIRMDASETAFRDMTFDMAVNFLGLEDIHMTRGKEGVRRTFFETERVIKPDGYFNFVVMPPEAMVTEAQKLEVELFSYICGATWLSLDEYLRFLEMSGLRFVDKRAYNTFKKLTPDQAKREIAFACENVPRIYGIKTPPLGKVWSRYGRAIEKYGLGHYSRVILIKSIKSKRL
jgi:ubiquinone/menaquinone biosynthesis C-methylase UbiE